jgi:hypothetical protein
VIEQLAFMAKTHKIYLVANLLEKSEENLIEKTNFIEKTNLIEKTEKQIKFYNTAIAFDRNGKMVAK